MSGPNRWSRNQESTARSSNDPPNRDQEYQAYQSEDSEYDEPQAGFTARKSREFPVDSTLSTGISCTRGPSRIQFLISSRMPMVFGQRSG